MSNNRVHPTESTPNIEAFGFNRDQKSKNTTKDINNMSMEEIPPLKSLYKKDGSTIDNLITWYAYHAIKRSALWGFLGFFIPILIAVITLASFPLTIDTGQSGWFPRASSYARMQDGQSAAEEVTVFNPLRVEEGGRTQARQSIPLENIAVYFWDQDSDADLITADKIAKIKAVEEAIYALPDFEKFCYKLSGECQRPQSLTKWAYAQNNPNCPGTYVANGMGNAMVPNLKSSLISAINSSYTPTYCNTDNCTLCPQYPNLFELYVTKDHTQAEMDTEITKSSIFFGFPLEGFDNVTDRIEEQMDLTKPFLRKIRDDVLAKDYPEFTVRYLNTILINDYFDELIISDVINVVISIALVFLYIWFHTKSLFLSGFGIGHVILSFPLAYLFMCVFLRNTSMGVLNFMSLFIILGIGADDVFIFLDAWKQSDHTVPRDEEQTEFIRMHSRLSVAYRRSSWAMLITSLTTSAAFLMNLTSSLPAIQIFGFFTAFMVMANYFMIISYFPAMVMFYEKYIRERVCGCWNPCLEFDKWKEPCAWNKCCAYCSRAPTKESSKSRISLESVAKPDEENPKSLSLADNIDDFRWLERFLYRSYAPAVYNKRWFVIVGSAIIIGLAAYFASTIENSDEPTQWLRKDNPIQQPINWEEQKFARDSELKQVNIINGVDEVNRDGTNMYESNDIGSAQFRAFDITKAGVQEQLLAQCESIKEWDYILFTEGKADILCPIAEFKEYIENEVNGTFPVPTTEVLTKLAEFASWYESENDNAVDYSDMKTFDERDTRRRQYMTVQQSIRFDKNGTDGTLELKAMIVVVNTTIQEAPASKVEPIYNYFVGQIAKLAVTDGLSTPKQFANAWVSMELELTLSRSVVFGIGVSLAIAFVMIVLTTNDVLLSLMSVFTIGAIVVSLMANIVWLGWSISVVESICLTILVGLSVDYTIHIANSWRESSERDRLERVKTTLLEIGISILSAALTSVFACLPLLNTTIVFFTKFGIFIALTVVWSAFYSFAFFVALLAVMGPRSGRNDFIYTYNTLTCKSGKDEEEEDKDGNAVMKPQTLKITQI